jgi:dienelactone hydrolase
MQMVRVWVNAVTLVVAMVPSLAHSQVARVEVHPLPSVTLTDQEFLMGKREGAPVMVAGQLRIPRQGTDRLPAVILVHGSGGVSGYVDDWAQWLNAMGVATFVLDSFAGRGLVSVGNDQGKLGRLAMIVDTYRALELLANHLRIDASRIAVMGFSRGGQAALYSSMKRFQRMHLSGSTSFAAYIVFYPDCRTVYRDDEGVANVPIRIFHGGADDYSPVDTCRVYVDRLRKAGKDVELKEYAGAQHAFDWSMLKTPVKLPQAQTTRRCRLEESVDGTIINGETKNVFTYSDSCVEFGPTIAHSPEAFAEAQKDLRAFVLTVLNPK